MLWQEGYEQLDLTAGGEPYKERFANAWDEVHTLGAFPMPLARQKAVVWEGVKDAAKTTLHRFGIRPEQARSVASELKRLRPARVPAVVFGRARAWIGSRHETRVYSHEVATASHPDVPPLIRRDALEDLLDHHPDEAWPSRQGFLSAALERIEDSQHFYTSTEGGRLLHLGWLAERPTEALVGRAIPGFRLPPASALVLDLDTAPGPRGRGLGALSLRAMLRDAARFPGTERVYIAVPADNGPARRVVEKVGFTYERSLFEETRFGRSRRSTVPPATEPGGADHQDLDIGVPTAALPKRPVPTPAER
jgi:RimJ/RimL family protein N-acetyltransferase